MLLTLLQMTSSSALLTLPPAPPPFPSGHHLTVDCVCELSIHVLWLIPSSLPSSSPSPLPSDICRSVPCTHAFVSILFISLFFCYFPHVSEVICMVFVFPWAGSVKGPDSGISPQAAWWSAKWSCLPESARCFWSLSTSGKKCVHCRSLMWIVHQNQKEKSLLLHCIKLAKKSI